MKRILDPIANPGDLLHAALEGWTVAAMIEAALLPLAFPQPTVAARRPRGIRSVRASRAEVSRRFRVAR